MLTRRSKLRDWGLFALVALLPTIAVGLVALRALRNEEAAIRREMRTQLEHTATDVAERWGRSIAAMKLALSEADLEGAAERPPGALEAYAVYADWVVLDDSGQLLRPAAAEREDRRPLPTSPACRRAADQLLERPPLAQRQAARALLLSDCPTVRSAAGRLLWPVLALAPGSGEPVSGAQLVAWVQEHGPEMSPVEAAALRADVEAAPQLSPGHRQQLQQALGSSSRSERDALQRIIRGRGALILSESEGGGARTSWRDSESLGELRRLERDGLAGFVVHPRSITRAVHSGWPPVPVGVVAELASTEPPAGAPTTALLPKGPRLVFRWADPDAVARQTRRSQLVLLGAAGGAGLAALAIAALLFARVRTQRRLGALQNDFVATVSHELRTPIASVRMLAELLAEGRVPEEEQEEVYQALAHESQRLSGTTERLLTFSRMQAGKRRRVCQRASVAELVQEVVDDAERRHSDQPPIEYDVKDDASADVDPDGIRMAVENLIANAYKYAPNGTPYEVSVGSEAKEVVITVCDHGPGIPQQDRRRVLRPFERADNRLSEATDGSGIGLALVQHVAQAHGGSVRIDSRDGEGACFMLRFPQERR